MLSQFVCDFGDVEHFGDIVDSYNRNSRKAESIAHKKSGACGADVH